MKEYISDEQVVKRANADEIQKNLKCDNYRSCQIGREAVKYLEKTALNMIS